MEKLSEIFIQLPVLLFSIVLHEAAHAYVADKLGDSTARRYGRLTLNPLPHIDMVGTILLPIISIVFGGLMFGWAKPVPIDTRSFKKIKKSIFFVSFAGPLSNFILAILCTFILAFMVLHVPSDFYLFKSLKDMAFYGIRINIVLAVFNLLPIPPLDGSKMLSTVLSYKAMKIYEQISNYSFLIFIVLIMSGAYGYILRPFFMVGQIFLEFFLRVLS